MKKIMSKLLGISEKSYYRWKKETHIKLIDLIEKHFDENDLIEFLETGKISKFEKKEIEDNDMNEFLLNTAISKIKQNSEMMADDIYTWNLKTKHRKKITGNIIDYFKTIIKDPFIQYKSARYFPLGTFLSIINDENVKDVESFKNIINKIVDNDVRAEIIESFIENILSKLELEQLLIEKEKVISFFEMEKEYNSRLNWN